MSEAQPSGTVTLVFTDVEGSTKLLDELGTDGYREALGEHRRVVREAFVSHRGYEVDYEGDAFFYAFASAESAVSAVSEAMLGLEAGPIRIRVGIHTGEPLVSEDGYVGVDVHRAARIMAAGHGGQVLVSETAQRLAERDLRDLGLHRLKDMSAPQRLYQAGAGGFPPLKSLNQTNLTSYPPCQPLARCFGRCGLSLRERSRFCSPTSKARRACCTSSDRKATPQPSPSIVVC